MAEATHQAEDIRTAEGATEVPTAMEAEEEAVLEAGAEVPSVPGLPIMDLPIEDPITGLLGPGATGLTSIMEEDAGAAWAAL